MSVHKHNSWGRTRRPKSLYDDGVVPTKQTATSVTCVAAGDLADSIDSGDAGKNGYVTENQRFLQHRTQFFYPSYLILHIGVTFRAKLPNF